MTTSHLLLWTVSYLQLCDSCPDSGDQNCDAVKCMCETASLEKTNSFLITLMTLGITAIALHVYAIICGLGILHNFKLKICHLSFPLRNIFFMHFMIASSCLIMVSIWYFSDNGTVNSDIFFFGKAIWIYFSLVAFQLCLRLHFMYYNSHLKRLRSYG